MEAALGIQQCERCGFKLVPADGEACPRCKGHSKPSVTSVSPVSSVSSLPGHNEARDIEAKKHIDVAEDNEETKETEGFYSAFNLRENPFRYSDASIEQGLEIGAPFVDHGLLKRLRGLAEDGISAILRAPRGTGKTAALVELSMGDWHWKREDVVFVTDLHCIDDIYEQLFIALYRDYEKQVQTAIVRLWGRSLERLTRWIRVQRTLSHEGQTLCRECGGRIILTVDRPTEVAHAYRMHIVDNPHCSSLRRLVEASIEHSLTLFLDLPDELPASDMEALARLYYRIAGYSGNIIITANLKQAAQLSHHHTFSRAHIIDIDPSNTQLHIDIYYSRIKASTEPSDELRSPFNPEVIQILAERAGTPREFLQSCSRVLLEMRIRGMTGPCGPDFIESFNAPAYHFLDEARIVQETIAKLRDSGRSWVKVKDLVKLMVESGLETTSQRLGRQLGESGFGLPRRRNPDAEYNVSAMKIKQ